MSGVLGRWRHRFRAGSAANWTIITSAPKGEAGEQWGDTWFARDLAAALRRLGQRATVVSRAGATKPERVDDDVVVVLRGLRAVEPPSDRRGVWLLWVISHPELVTEDEMASYDGVFAASESWQPSQSIDVTPLLQATASERFHVMSDDGTANNNVLFVGSTRGLFRPSVRGALASRRSVDLAVYGVGWEEFIPKEHIRSEFLANEDLPRAYAMAQIVLNDHHREMAAEGFLSNRLFDAVAAGARVLSDDALGLREVFGDAVVVYADEPSLVDLLNRPVEEVFPDAQKRRANGQRIASEHSFDVRARVLLDRARQLKEHG